MRTVETKNCIVTFPDDQATRDAVFELVVKFFLDHETFSGESAMQRDAPQVDAPQLLCDLVDDVLKFKVDYKE